MGKDRRKSALKAWKTKREKKARQDNLEHIVNSGAQLIIAVCEKAWDFLTRKVEPEPVKPEPKKETPPRKQIPRWMRDED